MIPVLLCSLPVNDEIIQAVLDNPDVTIKDLYALEASVSNQMGAACPWVQEIITLQGDIVLRAYGDCDAELENDFGFIE